MSLTYTTHTPLHTLPIAFLKASKATIKKNDEYFFQKVYLRII